MEERQIVKVGIIGAGERGVYTLGARMAERFKQERFLVTALADYNGPVN
jgi:hypothetical protein